jgi:hypothetical protein
LKWDSEEHFVNDFIVSGIKIFDSVSFDSIKIKELKTGYGRPDVVFIQYDSELLNSKNLSRILILNRKR